MALSPRIKFILQIFGFIVLVILLAWALWAVFFRSSGVSIIPGRTVELPQGQLPDIATGPGGRVVDTAAPTRLSTLVQEPLPEEVADVVAAGGRTRVTELTRDRAEFNSLTSRGSFNYYDLRNERFYQVSPGAEPRLLSSKAFPSVDNVTWSHNGSSAILEFPDGSNVYYDFARDVQATLPQQAQEFSFSQNDSELAYEYIGEAEDDRWIIRASVDGQGQELIQPLGRESRNVAVDWSPNNQVIATFREPTGSLGEEVFFIGFNNENFLSLQTNGLGFEGRWSPKGKQMLYSVYSANTNYNPELHIAGAQGDNIGLGNRSLRVQTWPDKCSFASEELVYCAVPQFLEEGSGIFREQAQNSIDTIYKIDLINNSARVLAFPETEEKNSFTIESMSVSSNGRELYFTDRVNGRIHTMHLP
jgi:hypothetical protein